MDNFEGITPAECRPLARRLLTLAVHAERIQWPEGILKDLRDAALVLEITAERAEGIDKIAAQARHRAEAGEGIPTRLNDPAAHVVADPVVGIPTRLNDPRAHEDPFSTPRRARYGHAPGVEDPMSREIWTKESDATKDYG